MKWFKHMADASADEFIARLEDELGLEAIARWWKMLEAIAIQMDKTDRCFAEYPIRRWMVLLSCKQRKVLETFVKVLQNFGKISVNWSENILKIECPKLLEFRDEYSKKSGVAPDIVRTKTTDTEEEVEEERRKKERLTPTPKRGREVDPVLFPVTPSSKPDRFPEFYAVYPKKGDRKAAEKSFARAKTRAAEEIIIMAASLYADERSEDTRPTSKQFTKNATTWLNNDCWLDYADRELVNEDSLSPGQKIERMLRQVGLE